MASLEEIRQKYPQYRDLSDEDLADKLHGKYYPDLSAEDFRQRIGFEAPYAPIPGARQTPEMRPLSNQPPSFAEGVGRSLAQGAAFGGADEFAARMASLTGVGGQAEGADYETLLAAERARDEQIPASVAIPGKITGGVLGTAAGGQALGPAVGAIPGAARAAAAIPGWMKAAGLGGLYGGAYGFGEGEGGVGPRLEAAGQSALIGGGLGAAGYPVVKGLGWAGGQLWESLRKRFAAPMSSAMSKVWQNMVRDEMSAARLGQRLAAVERGAPGQAIIADVGGKNLQGLARHTASVPGQAQNRAAMVLNQRAQGEASRINRAITKGLDPEDYYAAQDAFLTNTRTIAAPLYQKAYEQYPAVSSAPLGRLLDSPTGQKALKEAIVITQNERAAGIAGPDIAKAVESGNIPLQVWDDIKRGFDALMQKGAYRNELSGRLNAKGFSVDAMRRTLLKELDKATGGAQGSYASARRVYAGEAEAIEALRDGRKLFTMDPEAITRQLGKLSDAGKESFRSGAARAMKDTVNKTQDKASASKRLFGNAQKRAQIRAVFPDSKSYRELQQSLISEQRFSNLRNYAQGGSQTTPRAAESADALVRAGEAGGVIAGTKVGGAVGAHTLMAAGMGRRVGAALMGNVKQHDLEVAKMLFNRDPVANRQVLDALMKKDVWKALPETVRGEIGRALLLTAAQQGSEAGTTAQEFIEERE